MSLDDYDNSETTKRTMIMMKPKLKTVQAEEMLQNRTNTMTTAQIEKKEKIPTKKMDKTQTEMIEQSLKIK